MANWARVAVAVLVVFVCGAGAHGAGQELLDLARPETPRLDEVETTYLYAMNNTLRERLGEGWRVPHSDQFVYLNDTLWSTSIVSDLKVTVLRPRDLVLRLVIQPHFVETFPAQRVSVLWNGQRLGECLFDVKFGWAYETFEFSVKADIQTAGENKIEFLSHYAVSARDVGRGGENADSRPISFGLKWLHVLDPGELAFRPTPGVPTPEPVTPAATGDSVNLLQQPGTRVRVPFSAAPGAGLRFETGLHNGEGARVYVRWDTMDGVEETLLLDAGGSRRRRSLRLPEVSPFGEIVLDTTQVAGSEPVEWRRPILTGRREPKATVAVRARQQKPEVKNVVVFCLDALQLEGLGALGARRDASPFIDGLAANGLVYTRYYTHASWTYPSIMSFFTGLYPPEHGVHYVRDLVNPEVPRLSEVLGAAKVRTACYGENPFFAPHYQVEKGFDDYQYISPRRPTAARAVRKR